MKTFKESDIAKCIVSILLQDLRSENKGSNTILENLKSFKTSLRELRNFLTIDRNEFAIIGDIEELILEYTRVPESNVDKLYSIRQELIDKLSLL